MIGKIIRMVYMICHKKDFFLVILDHVRHLFYGTYDLLLDNIIMLNDAITTAA